LHYYTEIGQSWPDMIFSPKVEGFIVGAIKDENERFIESVISDKPVMCTVEEGIEATRVAIAAKLSLQNSEVVYLKDVI